MGSYNDVVVGRGKNRAEALRQAWDEYVFENGHRCSLKNDPPPKGKLLRKLPPEKMHVEVKGRMEYHSMQPDPTAPASEWLEEWEFEVWVRS